MVYKYPVRLDIWQLITGQWEKLIEDLHILKNIEISQQLELTNNDSIDSIIENQDFL